jgi:CBS-domain-containing membrane protein
MLIRRPVNRATTICHTVTEPDREARPGSKAIARRFTNKQTIDERRSFDRETGASRLKPDPTARELMRGCAALLRPEDSIELAARLMSDSDSDAVPVVDTLGRLIGIISERDIAVKIVAPGQSLPLAQVSDCMTCEAFACSIDNSLESCVTAMSWHQVRRIAIVDDEHRVVGTIGQRDLAAYVCEHPERLQSPAMMDILLALAR